MVPGRRLPKALQQFVETEASAGIVLLAAAVVALVWANSPWRGAYRTLWATEIALDIGRYTVAEDLRHWVNGALMTLFFFVVGLEIKRELVRGDLRDPRTAALPAIAAVGGMAAPALLYVAVMAGSGELRGWGIPIATDIAFAIGIVALAGDRVPSSLKLFLLTLAIVDDIGAIAVIAVFYSGGIDLGFLAAAIGLLGAMVVLRRTGVVWMPAFVTIGCGVWLMTYLSGVHPTIAGVALGLLAPAHSLTSAALAREWAQDLTDEASPQELADMTTLAQSAVSPVERLEHRLHPWASFVAVPVFALANAGVAVEASSFGRVSVAIIVGLVLGKLVGIGAAVWLAVRAGVARLPAGATFPAVASVAAVGGVGFTVSLFVSELAFAPGAVQDMAKVGVLAGSALAAVVGSAALRMTTRP